MWDGWVVEFLSNAVEAELRGLPADMQARFFRIIELLESRGPERVGEPHVKHLDGKLWKMRMTGRDGIARAVYMAVSGRRLLVARIFIKKTQRAPVRELETARRRLKEAGYG